MINSCKKYVKPGGHILTTSLFSNNESIKHNEKFKQEGVIWCSNGKYKIDHAFTKMKTRKSKLKKRNDGLEYVDNEDYYIYRKLK